LADRFKEIFAGAAKSDRSNARSRLAPFRHQLSMRRADERDGLPFVSPVDAKIFPIHRDDAVAWVKLAHADEAKVG
jgi:hypothetical protein